MAKAPPKRKTSASTSAPAKADATGKASAKKAKAPARAGSPAAAKVSRAKVAAPPKAITPEIVDHPEVELRLEDFASEDDLRREFGEMGREAAIADLEAEADRLAQSSNALPVEIVNVDLEDDQDDGLDDEREAESLDEEVEAEVAPPKRKRVKKAKAPTSTALTTTDPVAIYLAELRKYPLLTREQERELAERYQETHDPKAAEALVTSNLRFVVKIAAEYSRFGAKLIDLIQEGNVGLMHAVKEFNPYKGVRLITYAVWWIRGYIQEYLMRQYSMVRIGTTQNQRKLFYRLQKEKDAISLMGQEPNVALLAGRLGVSEEEVETMTKRLSGRDVSLSTPIDGENSASSLLDFESSSDVAVDEAIGHLEEMEVLRENLEKIRPTLSEKETYILENRVLSEEPMTLQEIGTHYGVTREAVRQLEARLLGKIRAAVTQSLED